MSIQEIELEIKKLPTNLLIELSTWLEEYQEKVWDMQIEKDLEAGNFDSLFSELDAEYNAGLAKPL